MTPCRHCSALPIPVELADPNLVKHIDNGCVGSGWKGTVKQWEDAMGAPVDHLRSLTPYGPDHPDYPNAPSDWDGGPYLCRDGQFYHMNGYGWGHGLGCWNATADWDRIAYRRAAIAQPSKDIAHDER